MMLRLESTRAMLPTCPPPINFSHRNTNLVSSSPSPIAAGDLKLRLPRLLCGAARRRSVRFQENEDDEEEEYGYNEEIGMVEMYSQSATKEALIVHATVDEQDVEVLVFKGFSSSLSYGTSPDSSRSILPARAVIKFVDRVEGPFDPSDIRYIEKGLTWEEFKTRLIST